jgi:hypothetical protein
MFPQFPDFLVIPVLGFPESGGIKQKIRETLKQDIWITREFQEGYCYYATLIAMHFETVGDYISV